MFGNFLQVLLLLGAVASHKLVVGFCLGVELSSNPLNSMMRHFTSIAVFAFGSALGIAIGMMITGASAKVIPNTMVAALQVRIALENIKYFKEDIIRCYLFLILS